jgi:hypothetical protein
MEVTTKHVNTESRSPLLTAVPDQTSDLKATPMWYFDHMLRLSRLRYRHHPSQESLLDCHRWAVLYLDTMAGLDRFGFFHAIHDIQNRVYFSTGRYLLSVRFTMRRDLAIESPNIDRYDDSEL